MVDALGSAGVTVERLVVVGGATRSPSFMQLYADVLGKTLLVPACAEATLVGAAVVAVAGHLTQQAGGELGGGCSSF